MRKSIFLLVATLAFIFVGCDNQKRLAQQLKGEWTSGVAILNDPSVPEAQIVDNLAFVVDSTDVGGMIVATGFVELTLAPPFNGSVVETVNQGVAAQATVQGTWRIIDDDEVAVAFDFSTLEVNVDPASVGVQANLFDGMTAVEADSISRVNIARYQQQITTLVKKHFSKMQVLHDVEVKSNTMKMEIADKDYFFHRETIN